MVAVTTTKLSVVTTLPPPSCVIIALADSSIHYLNRDCLKEIATSSLNMPWRQDEPSNKYQRLTLSISHVDISWLGGILLVCDTQGTVYLYRLLLDGGEHGGDSKHRMKIINVNDDVSGPSISLVYACTMLEYCLVTGLDCLDLLLCLRPSMIETLCERLDISYNRQPAPIQQYYYVQFLCIKTCLLRSVSVFCVKETRKLISLLFISEC